MFKPKFMCIIAVAQHRTSSRTIVVSLSCFAYHNMKWFVFQIEGWWDPRVWKVKKRLTSTHAPKFTFKWRFPTLALVFLQIAWLKFYLKLQSPRFFCKIFQFQVTVIGTCWKNPKLNREIFAHFEKMSLAADFEHFFFEKNFCLLKWAKMKAFSCFYLVW